MKLLPRLIQATWIAAWYLFAAVVVVLAAVFSTARLLLPTAEDYRAEAEKQLSAYVGQPVRINKLDAAWRGLTPAGRVRAFSI